MHPLSLTTTVAVTASFTIENSHWHQKQHTTIYIDSSISITRHTSIPCHYSRWYSHHNSSHVNSRKSDHTSQNYSAACNISTRKSQSQFGQYEARHPIQPRYSASDETSPVGTGNVGYSDTMLCYEQLDAMLGVTIRTIYGNITEP